MTNFRQRGDPNTGFKKQNENERHLIHMVHVRAKSLGHVSLHAAKFDSSGKTALRLQQAPDQL